MARVRDGRKIFLPDFTKSPPAIIQPDLKKLVSESLLDDQVDRAILVNVQGRNCERTSVRFEPELTVPAVREMQFYRLETSLRPTVSDEDCTIRLIVTVEICGSQRLTQRR